MYTDVYVFVFLLERDYMQGVWLNNVHQYTNSVMDKSIDTLTMFEWCCLYLTNRSATILLNNTLDLCL